MNPRVLLVDDDEAVLSGLAATLDEEGFTVLTAASGPDALQVLSSHVADIVLADLVMDGMDGIALLRRLSREQPTLPVVVLTGHGTPASAVEALREGAADFIQKPAQPADIALRLRAALDARRLRGRLLEERDFARSRDQRTHARREQARRVLSLRRFSEGLARMTGPSIEALQRVAPEFLAGLSGTPALAAKAETMGESTNRLGEILHRFRQVGKGERAGRSRVDLNRLIRKLVEPHAPVPLQLAERLPPVAGAPVRLTRALRTLLDVARDGLPGGKRITVQTSAGALDSATSPNALASPATWVRVDIREPRTLTPEQVESVFEPFYADMELNRASNEGFRLTVAYLIAEAHGGAVWVEPELDGVRWVLALPAAVREEEAAEEKPVRREGPDRPLHVLVVDDQAEYREEAMELLRSLGCRVSAVANAQAAMTALEAAPAELSAPMDLVFIDLVLSDALDGVDVFHEIRRRYPSLNVVLIGGFVETDRVAEARKQGVCEYLRKPLTREALARALRHAEG